MSETYSNILDGIDTIIKNIQAFLKEKESPPETRARITHYLSTIWFGEDASIRLLYRGEERTIGSMAQEFHKGDLQKILDDCHKNWDSPALGFQWLDAPPKNWDKRKAIYKFYNYTVLAFDLAINSRYTDDIKKGVLNIFLRLTNYNDRARVLIRDLVDYPTAKYLIKIMNIHSDGIDINPNDEYSLIEAWSTVIEGILFTLLNMDIEFPAPYYPGLGVLEKKDTLYQALTKLEESFSPVIEGKKG